MSTTVAKAKETTLAQYDYGDDAGAGFENQTSEDYRIPFLGVLQAMSPQIKDPEDGGIKDARPGMLINTVTNEVFSGKDGVEFVPAATEHVFVEWVPRDQGGGFVGRHNLDSPVVAQAKANSAEFGKYRTPEGNELRETFYVYGVLCRDGDAGEMVAIAFTSTKIKIYKTLITKLKMLLVNTPKGKRNPPLYGNLCKITTIKQKNNLGEFYNFSINPAVDNNTIASLLPPDDERYQAGKSCLDMIKAGLAQVAYETQHEDTPSDDKVPF